MSILSDRKISTAITILMVMLTVTCGCRKTVQPEPDGRDFKAKKYLYEVCMTPTPEIESKQGMLTGYYYWYDRVSPRPFTYDETIFDFYDAILYSGDRWSWMIDAETYLAGEVGTVYDTFGASFGQAIEYYGDYSVRVRYVYPESPFYNAGVRRGWEVSKINGVKCMEMDIAELNTILLYPTAGVSYRFTFKDTEGNSHEADIKATHTLSTRTAIETKIFTAADFPGLKEDVGYFHYLSFKTNFISDFTDAIQYFKSHGVRNMILDLRYNGGGDIAASTTLANLIANKETDGMVLTNRVHNKRLSFLNEETVLNRITGKSLDLECIYIITGEGSASASELLINGLKPLMNVQQVGDTTYGKPNGMYVMMYPGSREDYARYNTGDFSRLEYVFLPICYYNLNCNGESIPDTGIIPDSYRPDDLYHDFDAKEDNIASCLYHIVHGAYPPMPAITKSGDSYHKDFNLNEEKRNRNYGISAIKF